MRIFVISIICLILTYSFSQISILKSLDKKTYDSLYYFRGPQEDREKNVVIVSIDEESIRSIGTWPWPRSRLAQLIRRIKEGHPKVLGIDIFFDIPSNREEDDQLAQVLANPPRTIIPIVLRENDNEILFRPLGTFVSNNTRLGVVNVLRDPFDGAVKEFQPFYDASNRSFPLAVIQEYLDMGPNDIKARDFYIEFGEYRIPLADSRALINFKGAKIDPFSAQDVLDPSFDPSFFFEGRIVLLGRTDLGSKDFLNTPVPAKETFETLSMAGVEIWKEAIDTILQKRFLYRPAEITIILIMFILSILISAAMSMSNKHGTMMLFISLLLLISAFYGLFLKKNVVMPALSLVTVCLLTYLSAFLYNYVVLQTERNRISAAFKSYLSEHVLQNIMDQRIDLKVGGKRKNLTIFFADIKGFSNYADTQGPEAVLDLLKQFFAQTNKVIIDHNGIVDKLMGDGILAFFGDFTDTNHALDAVNAALKMQEKISQLRARMDFDLAVRIGINTGDVTVGNIGSEEHLDYTVIGKDVNLAQRLEASCEEGKILISESTYELVKENVDVDDWREISLKGFAKKVKVCTVIGLKPRG